MSGKSRLTFEALPPELRAVVYNHLFSNLSILVSKDGKLDTSQYAHQISVVSKSSRNETLPLLRDSTSKSQLRLFLEHGRFPEHIRRRLPTYVCRSIRVITILDQVEYDDVKPTLTTFPNLLRLEFDLCTLKQDCVFPYDNDLSADREESSVLSYRLCELQREQERPGEGLERDYLPENTLWQVCRMSRARRGFDVCAQLRFERIQVYGRETNNSERTVTLHLAWWGVTV